MDTRNNKDDNLHADDYDHDSQLKDEESAKAEKWKKHYSSKHMILLVGEGDFSFLFVWPGLLVSAHNLVATSLDSHDDIGRTTVMDSAMRWNSKKEIAVFFRGLMPRK